MFCHDIKHPQRPRGCLSGQEKQCHESFQEQVEDPQGQSAEYGRCMGEFCKKYISNKGLKMALHTRDLVEFCHTLRMGTRVPVSGVARPFPNGATKIMPVPDKAQKIFCIILPNKYW